MANSTADGSVVIDVNMDVSQAEKRLGKLRENIKKTEQEVSKMTEAREKAKETSLFQAAELDAEKAKLQEIKDRLADIRAMSKDKSISIDQREAYKAQIPAIQQELADQTARVRGLQAEWNKTENAVDSYGRKIDAANQKVSDMQAEAGILTQEIDEATRSQGLFKKSSDAAEQAMDRLANRIKGLATRAFVFSMITKALRAIRDLTMSYIKTNDEARQAIANLKGALLTLAQPLVEVIIPAFTALVNILARVVTAIAQFVSMLFGKSLKQSKDGAKAMYNEAKGIKAVGAAADEAAGSLAGFDEINTINTENAAGGGGGGAAEGTIAPEFEDILGGGILDRLKEIAELVGLIAAGLALWKISDMLPGVLGTIAQKLAGLLLTVGGLLLMWHGLTDAWENGVDWLNLIEMVGGLAAAAAGLYLLLGPVAAGIALIVGGLALLVTGFHDAMENGWNLQNTLLSIAGILAAGLGISLITGSWIPLLISGISSVLLALTVATGHGEELIAGIQEVIEGFKDFFTGIFTGDMEKAAQGITKIFSGLQKSIFAVIDGLKDALLNFLNWLDEKTNGKFSGIINAAKNLVVVFFENTLKPIFSGFIQFLTGAFAGDWNKAWEGVKNIFKGAWNGIVGLLESAVNLIISGLNWLIRQMNKIQFTTPDWVPGIGGKSIGINIPQISEAKILRLAQGAVIPANREFLAVLGDQKSGTNIEAPLDTIKQALAEVMASYGGAGGDIHITVELDGKVVARNTVHHINDMTRQAGKPVLLY